MPRQLHWIEKGTKPKLITKHCIIFPLEAEIQRSFNLKFSLFEWIFNSLNLLRAELPHNFSELVNIPTYIFLSNTCLSLLVSTLGLVLLNFNGKIHFIGRKVHSESIIQVTLFFSDTLEMSSEMCDIHWMLDIWFLSASSRYSGFPWIIHEIKWGVYGLHKEELCREHGQIRNFK